MTVQVYIVRVIYKPKNDIMFLLFGNLGTILIVNISYLFRPHSILPQCFQIYLLFCSPLLWLSQTHTYAAAKTRWGGVIQTGNQGLKERFSGNWRFKKIKTGVCRNNKNTGLYFFPLIHTSSGCICSLNFLSLSNIPLIFSYTKNVKGESQKTWCTTLYYVNEEKRQWKPWDKLSEYSHCWKNFE